MIPFHLARWLDRRLGQPVCVLIGFLRRFRRRKTLSAGPIRNVLVIKMWGLGSIVLASPVFAHLRRHYPTARIAFLTLRQNQGLYEGRPELDDVHFFDMTSFYNALNSFFKLTLWLWREQFEVIIDLEFGSRFTAILTFLSFKSLTIGYVPAGSGKDIFDITIPYTESIHITRVFLRAIDALGLPVADETLLPLPISAADQDQVARFLQEQVGRDFIVLNPNTSALALERLWPPEYFADLGQQLLDRFPDVSLVLIGGPEDHTRVAHVRSLIKSSDRVLQAAGRFSLRQTAYLLSRARVFVSNDSGPLHLGVAMGVPSVGLFGPETPVLYGPRGPRHAAISSGEICSPCISVYNDKVVNCRKDAICMKHITVARVLAAVCQRFSASVEEWNADAFS